MKKIIILGAMLAVAVPLVGFALPLPYWGTNPPLLPCTGADCVSICQMVELGQNVIWLGMSIVVFAIAPILIAWGGILVLTAGGAEERMKTGKKVITSALIGMALALGAFMIVNTFFVLMGITFDNPNQKIDWANISCTQGEFPRPPSGGAGAVAPGIPSGAPPPTGEAEGTGWSGATPPAGTLSDAEAWSQLSQPGISRLYLDCTYAGQKSGCTSFTGLPQSAVDDLLAIKSGCHNCVIMINGGTEAGHATVSKGVVHGMGNAVVDLNPSSGLDSYIYKEIRISTTNPLVSYERYQGNDGHMYMYETSPPHWHVEF